MRLLLAIVNPWIVFVGMGRIGTGVACLVLQLTLVGWIPATAWAVHALRREAAKPKPKKFKTFNIIPKDMMPQKTVA